MGKEKLKNDTEDLPLASMVIEEYRCINQTLKETNQKTLKTNKTLVIIIGILLVFLAIETTYIILYWDLSHPTSGVIRNDK